MTVDHTFVPYATPSEDNYSSEEELKEIINEQETSLKKKSPSKKEKSLSSLAKNEKKSSSASSSSGPGSSSRAPSASEGGLNNNKVSQSIGLEFHHLDGNHLKISWSCPKCSANPIMVTPIWKWEFENEEDPIRGLYMTFFEKILFKFPFSHEKFQLGQKMYFY